MSRGIRGMITYDGIAVDQLPAGSLERLQILRIAPQVTELLECIKYGLESEWDVSDAGNASWHGEWDTHSVCGVTLQSVKLKQRSGKLLRERATISRRG